MLNILPADPQFLITGQQPPLMPNMLPSQVRLQSGNGRQQEIFYPGESGRAMTNMLPTNRIDTKEGGSTHPD